MPFNSLYNTFKAVIQADNAYPGFHASDGELLAYQEIYKVFG
jgi:hypothetical protein